MNISFIFGVLSTLAAEFIFVIILGIYLAMKDRKKGGESDAQKDNPVPTGNYNSGGKWYDGTC